MWGSSTQVNHFEKCVLEDWDVENPISAAEITQSRLIQSFQLPLKQEGH